MAGFASVAPDAGTADALDLRQQPELWRLCGLARPYESDPRNIVLGPHCQCGLRAKYMRGRGAEAARSNRMPLRLSSRVGAAVGGQRRPTQQSVTLAGLSCKDDVAYCL